MGLPLRQAQLSTAHPSPLQPPSTDENKLLLEGDTPGHRDPQEGSTGQGGHQSPQVMAVTR